MARDMLATSRGKLKGAKRTCEDEAELMIRNTQAGPVDLEFDIGDANISGAPFGTGGDNIANAVMNDKGELQNTLSLMISDSWWFLRCFDRFDAIKEWRLDPISEWTGYGEQQERGNQTVPEKRIGSWA